MSEETKEPGIDWGIGDGGKPEAPSPPMPPAATELDLPSAEIPTALDDGPDVADRRERAPAGLQKLGILGGMGVGKSYLFQGMVYRTYDGRQSGALTAYLERDSISLSSGLGRGDSDQHPESLAEFIRNYASWNRLAQTSRELQRWYRLRLPYRTGLLGRGRGALEVELFDGTGEAFEALLSKNDALWREGYLDAGVMIFCLPLWAAFPAANLPTADTEKRHELLAGFAKVVDNYRELRRRHRQARPVRSVLALTMADDPRTSLAALRERWILPYLASPRRYLSALRQEAGIMRYLANARRVSALLAAEFDAAPPLISAIPRRLDFDGGAPWLVPLSAIEGGLLDLIAQSSPTQAERLKLDPPVPAHVELPLLVALCERENALM